MKILTRGIQKQYPFYQTTDVVIKFHQFMSAQDTDERNGATIDEIDA